LVPRPPRAGRDDRPVRVPSTQLKAGDRCVVSANQVIPGDGDVMIVGGLIYFPMLILGPIGERITGLAHR
jgi:hypothetical protein